jgi:hypothetical protein
VLMLSFIADLTGRGLACAKCPPGTTGLLVDGRYVTH